MTGIYNQDMYMGDHNDKTLLWDEGDICPSLWIAMDDNLLSVAVAVRLGQDIIAYTVHHDLT